MSWASMGPRAGGVARFLAWSVVTGVVLAFAVLPVVGAGGWGVKQTSAWLNAMPTELPIAPPSTGSVLLAADGKTVVATLFEHDRRPVSLEAVAPVMREAVVSIEDSRFYGTGGVDTRGTARAAVSSLLGRGVQGGSSITQQYVKNALLDAAVDERGMQTATGRSVDRKVREAKLAIVLAQEKPKDEILEGYLNLVYFGSGAYGVEAAAQRYFSVPARRLSLPQAALLAGLLQNPSGYDPAVHPEAARTRRDTVLARMRQLGIINAKQAATATATPLALRPSLPEQGCAESTFPFYCDWVYAQLLRDPRLGANTDERRRRLLDGGLRVRTGLDVRMQLASQRVVDKFIARTNRVAAVSVLVEPGTGLVRAMAVNRDYGTRPGQTVFPLASARSFQIGSTFKAFTLAAALESGVRLDDTLPGGDRYTSKTLANPPIGWFSNAADGHGTNLDLTRATAESVNTAYVQLQERVGTARVADAARRAGLPLPTSGPYAVQRREGSLTLGAREASALDVAAAYATFAAHGLACPPRAVDAITDGHAALRPATPPCQHAFTPAVADTVTSVLASVVRPGGTGAAAALSERPVAGKTGTTEDEGSAWFVGYTPQLVGAVLMSDPRGAAKHPLHNVLGVDRVYGGTLPAELWRDIMHAVLARSPVTQLPVAEPAYLVPGSAPISVIPTVAGLESGAAQARLEALGYTVRLDRVTSPPSGPALAPSPAAGSVLSSFPAAGSPAPPGSVVLLRVADL